MACGVTCQDTVPFTVWAAVKHMGDLRSALAVTASVGGDTDTNCAIVGGNRGAVGGIRYHPGSLVVRA